MKKILLLSYYWPPSGGPGVQRWLKNALYLRDFGWDSVVITPQNPVASSYDASLLEEVPADLKVIHTKARDPFQAYALLKGQKTKSGSTGGIGILNNPSRGQQMLNYIRANFFIPDARKGWNPYLLKAARQVLREAKIDAIISTGPPHSTHLAAHQLQKEFGIPWFADFRDPWVNIFYNKHFPRTARTIAKDQALEDLVLAKADGILTVSPGLKAEFEDRAQKIHLLYNGYDPKDLPKAQAQKSKHFSLSYTGNFKPNQNVPALWEALAELKAEETRFAEDLQINFVGNVDPSIRETIAMLNLESNVKDHGYQAHHYATEVMVNSVGLLFIVPQTKDNHLILTGKLFEYLGSGSPLICIGPPAGNAAQIIAECERGSTIDYADKSALKQSIRDLYQQWQASEIDPKLDPQSAAAYTRRGAAEQLAQLLNSLHEDH